MPTPAALLLAVAVPLALPQPGADRAADIGSTLRTVDDLRAAARYRAAGDELRGLLFRLEASALADPGAAAEVARVRSLLSELVALDEAAQRAAADPVAARRWLALLVDPARPNARTAEQARALTALAGHDASVRALLDAAFPARLEIAVTGDTPDPDLVAFPLENALVEMSRDALPISRGAGASTLSLRVIVAENDRRNSILAGTGMHSYAMSMIAVLTAPDGAVLAEVATTRSALGINPAFAAKSGMPACARTLYAALVDDVAKSAMLGR